MSNRWRAIIAFTIAFSVFAILVSPYAASELTTVHSPQKVRPPATAIVIALMTPLTIWSTVQMHRAWHGVARLVLPGSEVVALSCAWLC